jgi:hypothetical protein
MKFDSPSLKSASCCTAPFSSILCLCFNHEYFFPSIHNCVFKETTWRSSSAETVVCMQPSFCTLSIVSAADDRLPKTKIKFIGYFRYFFLASSPGSGRGWLIILKGDGKKQSAKYNQIMSIIGNQANLEKWQINSRSRKHFSGKQYNQLQTPVFMLLCF